MEYPKAVTAIFPILLAISTVPPRADVIRYHGMCEASAAETLDGDHFAVASDDSEILRIYQSNQDRPVSEKYRQPDITDIEGAARIDETIFWITSHSLNKNGKDKPERKQLFATTISNGALQTAGIPYRFLRGDIAAALRTEEADLQADLNIEGLASTQSQTLLVGLRGPLDADKKAYVLEISNPFELVKKEGGQRALVVQVHELKLFDDGEQFGRGIRSIDRVGNRYIIVAGSVPDSSDPARLYSWDGTDDENLQRLPDVDLGGDVPEALIAWGDNDVQLLGDNGDAKIDGQPCDDKHGKQPGAWFPSIRENLDPQ